MYQIDFTNAQGQAKTVNTSVNQTINGDALLIADELAAYSEIKVSINNNTAAARIFAGEVSLISTKPTPTPASFTWDISSLSSGDYEVFAKMPATANAALSTSATYHMILNGNSAAGIDSVRNITTETDRVSLGEITITQDINNQITLSGNSANGLLYADALMFVPDMGPPVYVTSTDMYFVHSDHLGTPKLLTDTNGIVQWSIQTTPYGMLFQSEGTVSNIKAFPGQYVDEETGYSYNYFRDYDPSLGRYIQTDPIGLKGGLNTYGYVGGNPVSFVDPLGLFQMPGSTPVTTPVFVPQPSAPVPTPARPAVVPISPAFVGPLLLLMPQNMSSNQDVLPTAVAYQEIGGIDDPNLEFQCDAEGNDDPCGPLTRVQAYSTARMIAQIPRNSIVYDSFDAITDQSFKENCEKLLASGATFAGMHCSRPDKNIRIEDHPDGHPHMTGAGDPNNHKCPHLHVYVDNVKVATISYKRL